MAALHICTSIGGVIASAMLCTLLLIKKLICHHLLNNVKFSTFKGFCSNIVFFKMSL